MPEAESVNTLEDHAMTAANAAARRLIAFADDYTPDVSNANRVHVLTILWSWWRHCTHLAEGALAEVDRGSPFSATPSVRSMWEHVLRALWLSDEGEQAAVDLAADGATRQEKIAGAAPGSNVGWWSATPSRPLLDFNALVDLYPDVADYTQYRLLSNLSHPSCETARLYVRPDSQGRAELTNGPEDDRHADTVADLTIASTHHFLRLLTLLLEREPADPVLITEVTGFLLVTGEDRTLPGKTVRTRPAAQVSALAARAQSLLDAFAEADASGLRAVKAMSEQGAAALPAGMDEAKVHSAIDSAANRIRDIASW